MKFKALKKWDNVDASKGLVFFAQLVDELLFDYSLANYKPSAMNSSLLVYEAVSTIKAIERGTIMKPNLRHIIDELCDALERDLVARSLISVEIGVLFSVLKDGKSTDGAISTTVDLLRSQIPLVRYKERNEELLAEEVQGAQDFSKIRALTRSYITVLLNSGYSYKYIQRVSRGFFFNSKNRISGNADILDYLKFFSGSIVDYQVLYRAPEYLLEFTSSAQKLGVEVGLQSRGFEEFLDVHNFSLRKGEVFVCLNEVKGQDPYRAKDSADKSIETLQTLIGLYHHKESPRPIVECLVKDSEKNTCVKVTRSVNPMHKCQDLLPSVASKKLVHFVSGFSMKTESFNKFHRSAELHAMALGSDSLENQMINLWIALESLVPNKSNGGVSQIEHIVSSILPFVNIVYVNRLLLRFTKDLIGWNRQLLRELVKNIAADGILEKVAHLIILPEHQDLRGRLESSFEDFYLLNDRYHHLKDVFSTPQGVVKLLDGNARRVEWQIRRIYRARNTIVHDGVTPTFTGVLIEGAHDYLDTVMSSLMAMASLKYMLSTIDQGFKIMELNYRSYYGALNVKKLKFEAGNIDALLFKYDEVIRRA